VTASFLQTKPGERSSTATGKRIIEAALAASGSAEAKQAIKNLNGERNWRFGYPKHMLALAKELTNPSVRFTSIREG